MQIMAARLTDKAIQVAGGRRLTDTIFAHAYLYLNAELSKECDHVPEHASSFPV